MKHLICTVTLLSLLIVAPASAQRYYNPAPNLPQLSFSDRHWIESQMFHYSAMQRDCQMRAARAQFVGSVAGGLISGLSSIAAAEENRKNMQSLYLKMEEMQREAAEKPFRMIWAVRFRAAMRQQSQPEWQINHWLKDGGVNPVEVDSWEALLSALPPPAAPPSTAAPLAAPAVPVDAPPAPVVRTVSAPENANLAAARKRMAEDLYSKVAEPNLSTTVRAKRIRALGFNPVTLEPLADDAGSSLAGR